MADQSSEPSGQRGPTAGRRGLWVGIAIGAGTVVRLLIAFALIGFSIMGRWPQCGGMMVQDGETPGWMRSRGGMGMPQAMRPTPLPGGYRAGS